MKIKARQERSKEHGASPASKKKTPASKKTKKHKQNNKPKKAEIKQPERQRKGRTSETKTKEATL